MLSVSRSLANILDGELSNIILRLLAVNYYRKALHLRWCPGYASAISKKLRYKLKKLIQIFFTNF